MYSTTLKPHLLFIFPFLASSIRVSDMRVPRYHLSGEDLQLDCSYEYNITRVETLYSIKWYRGQEHFYEFTPNKKQEIKSFPFKGLKVDLNKSRRSTVVLTDVDRNTSGTFRCEVMADKPSFETDSVSANLTVVDAPNQDLKIFGVTNQTERKIGEHIRVHCSVGESTPPSNLTWVINGQSHGLIRDAEKVRKSNTWGRPYIETSLDYFIDSNSFVKKEELRLECVSEIYVVYKRSQHLVVLNMDRPRSAGIGWLFFSSGSKITVPNLMIFLFMVSSELWAAY